MQAIASVLRMLYDEPESPNEGATTKAKHKAPPGEKSSVKSVGSRELSSQLAFSEAWPCG